MTYLLKYYVSAFTNTKSDHTLPIRYNNLTRWDAVLRHAQDINAGKIKISMTVFDGHKQQVSKYILK